MRKEKKKVFHYKSELKTTLTLLFCFYSQNEMRRFASRKSVLPSQKSGVVPSLRVILCAVALFTFLGGFFFCEMLCVAGISVRFTRARNT